MPARGVNHHCSCSKFAVQPQLNRSSSLTWTIVAVQNSRSSRNELDNRCHPIRIVAVQNSRSSRNFPRTCREQAVIVAVQNSRSSRNWQNPLHLALHIVAVQNSRSSRNRKTSTTVGARDCSCSKFAVQPQLRPVLRMPQIIVAVQNSRSSRNYAHL